MISINAYPVDPGKPMIYNKKSAERFFKCSKQPFQFRLGANKYIEIQYPEIRCISKQVIPGCCIGIDLEEWVIREESACISWIYQRRAVINKHFRRE